MLPEGARRDHAVAFPTLDLGRSRDLDIVDGKLSLWVGVLLDPPDFIVGGGPNSIPKIVRRERRLLEVERLLIDVNRDLLHFLLLSPDPLPVLFKC